MEKTDRELLEMLIEAIDYSFLKTDGTYDESITLPVMDKVNYIKDVLACKQEWTSEEMEMFQDLNATLVKFWIGKGRPRKEVKIKALQRMLRWYTRMGNIVQDNLENEQTNKL